MKIGFNEPPSAGFSINLNGQTYLSLGLIKHTTMAGDVIDMTAWEARCWDCDDIFVRKTKPLSGPENRRCFRCASPGKKVKGKPANYK